MIIKQELIDFEQAIKADFLAAKIRHPIHLSAGNEDAVIEIFKDIKPGDWCFSTHRSHLHALLKGIPKGWIREQIHRGNSMHLMHPEFRFFAQSIVAACAPVAVGVAMGIKRRGLKNHVWVFVGDMAATTGIFHESERYACGFDLPITFVVEDNGLSTNTPTAETWGDDVPPYKTWHYPYERTCPHINVDSFVEFR